MNWRTLAATRQGTSGAHRSLKLRLLSVGLGCLLVSALYAQSVLQRGYDAAVTGANLQETTLNTSNVRPGAFGMLFTLPVDDNVYAQPLYVPNVAIANAGTHNVVYVASMSDTLYAFDADAGSQLWSINLATLVGAVPVPLAQVVFSGNRNITGNLGILSTPVIDPTSDRMYVLAATLEQGMMVYRLHAIDIRSGKEPLGAGVVIAGTHGGLTFDARYVTQRVSLAMAGNQIVFAFGALEAEYAGAYSGWVMAYNKNTLKSSGAIATVTGGTNGGGVWQSGRPAVIDPSGYAYVYTGNGYSEGFNGKTDFAESVLKFNTKSKLSLVDYFTPADWSSLDAGDLDTSSAGPLLIPGTNLLGGGGKNGIFYMLNTESLGKISRANKNAIQQEKITLGEFRGGPVFWVRSQAAGGDVLYNWGSYDALKSYPFSGSTIATSPSGVGGNSSQTWPGGILSLSANQDTAGSGIIWANVATSGDANNNPPVPGALYAFDAGNVSNELWDSNMDTSRDSYGYFAKFVPPMVANGKVYVATFSKQVAVYGLLH